MSKHEKTLTVQPRGNNRRKIVDLPNVKAVHHLSQKNSSKLAQLDTSDQSSEADANQRPKQTTENSRSLNDRKSDIAAINQLLDEMNHVSSNDGSITHENDEEMMDTREGWHLNLLICFFDYCHCYSFKLIIIIIYF